MKKSDSKGTDQIDRTIHAGLSLMKSVIPDLARNGALLGDE